MMKNLLLKLQSEDEKGWSDEAEAIYTDRRIAKFW